MNDHDLKWTMAHEFSFDLIGSPFFLGGGGLKLQTDINVIKTNRPKQDFNLSNNRKMCTSKRE